MSHHIPLEYLIAVETDTIIQTLTTENALYINERRLAKEDDNWKSKENERKIE